jgi:hypothetical protein
MELSIRINDVPIDELDEKLKSAMASITEAEMKQAILDRYMEDRAMYRHEVDRIVDALLFTPVVYELREGWQTEAVRGDKPTEFLKSVFTDSMLDGIKEQVVSKIRAEYAERVSKALLNQKLETVLSQKMVDPLAPKEPIAQTVSIPPTHSPIM